MDDLERAIQGGAELALQGDQLGEGSRLDTEPELAHIHRAVERPTERDVERQPAPARLDLHVAREHERGDVPEAHRLDPTVAVQARRAGEPARRNVDRDRDLTGARFRRDATGVDRPGHQRDRPVPARRRVALVVEEHDAQVAVGVVGWRDEAAVHVGVAARLVDEELADVVDIRGGPAAAFRHGPAFERRDTAGHDPERLATGVVVGRRDLGQRASRASRRALTPGHSPASTL